MRPAELAASAEVIGFDEVVMLGYRDSGMADSEPNDHPDCFHQADLDEATGRLVAVIRRTQPQVIITYGDDQRGYPHPDHLRVHDISVLAFERAGDPDVVSRARRAVPAVEAVLLGLVAGAPDRGPRGAAPAARRVAVRRGLVRAPRRRPPHHDPDRRVASSCGPAPARCAPTPPRSIPTRRSGSGSTDDELAEIYPWEDWILARSFVGPIPEDDGERDLFAGIREP